MGVSESRGTLFGGPFQGILFYKGYLSVGKCPYESGTRKNLAKFWNPRHQAALDGALDVGLSCMAANLSSTLSKTLLESSPAWAALSPFLEAPGQLELG